MNTSTFLKESGDIADTPGCTLEGTAGSVIWSAASFAHFATFT
jgi:hypothetical protein